MQILYELQRNCLAERIFLTTLPESHVTVQLLVYVLNQNPKSLSVFKTALLFAISRKKEEVYTYLAVSILMDLFTWNRL
jgi:hypothetical protein